MDKYITTLEVIKDYFTFRLNESNNLNKYSLEYFTNNSVRKLNQDSHDSKQKILNTIRMLCYEAEIKNKQNFDYYIGYRLEKVDDLKKDDYYLLIVKLQDVADLLFNDNHVDWARIISLISFVSYFSFKYAWINKDLFLASSCACKLIEWLTSFLTCKCGMWIECNGGWESFANHKDSFQAVNVKQMPCC